MKTAETFSNEDRPSTEENAELLRKFLDLTSEEGEENVENSAESTKENNPGDLFEQTAKLRIIKEAQQK